MIALMEKKDVNEKKEVSEKYVYKAMKNFAIQVNKSKNGASMKEEKNELDKKNSDYFNW